MLKSSCLLAALLVTSGGCAGRPLYHYHRTVVGIDISGNVSDGTPSGHLTLGYSRRLVVALPEDIQKALAKPTPAGVPPPDALPSTVFCTQVKASLGGVSMFREVLATGAPAEGYADQIVAAAASVPPMDRNFVCPGFVIPVPPPITDRSSPLAGNAPALGAAPQALPLPTTKPGGN